MEASITQFSDHVRSNELNQVNQVCHLPDESKKEEKEFGEAQKAKVAKIESKSTLTTKERVERYFSDIPIMVEVARCESTFRHYRDNGSVLRGYVNGSDVGVMQINEYYHGDRAAELGIDIFSIEGNMEYARYLYEEQGTDPWNASRPCWGGRAFELALRK